jgi:CRP/FNR family transcriptional regulator
VTTDIARARGPAVSPAPRPSAVDAGNPGLCAGLVPIFAALPPEETAALGRAMRHRRYRKGRWVSFAGDPVADLVVVASGRLHAVRLGPAGRDQVLRVLGAGEFAGERALFAPAAHEAGLVAVAPSQVCLVPTEAVRGILQRHPDAAVRLSRVLAERLAEAERRMGELALLDAGQRLAADLVRLLPGGVAFDGGVRLRLRGTWAQTAEQLGTTPETLSRRLRALVRAGVVRPVGRRTLLVLDPDRLQRLAGGSADEIAPT